MRLSDVWVSAENEDSDPRNYLELSCGECDAGGKWYGATYSVAEILDWAASHVCG